MALAVVHSRALDGLSAPSVSVEVHITGGLPSISLVGLPDLEVREARDRVRAAIQNSGFEFPAKRITINLAPADLPKESGRFDLPIAIGILAAAGQIPLPALEHYEFAGELSLSGALRSVRGALAMSLATGKNHRQLILPNENTAEASLASATEVLGADSLLDVYAHLTSSSALKQCSHDNKHAFHPPQYPDLRDIKGQTQAKRVLEIAAAGGHSLLLIGPPGTGKSMLANRLPGLLPPLSEDESLESAAILSLNNSFESNQFGIRPFRSPHHTASTAALIGGGSIPRPGEISLSHHGVLFLDELPEFDKRVLESLREPLESGFVHVARVKHRYSFPAKFQLVAAMNPCPCGYLGHPQRSCRCTPDQVSRYRGKLSGPLLDRIDLYIEVPVVPHEVLQKASEGEYSHDVKQRVHEVRHRQHSRQQCLNAALPAAAIDEYCPVDVSGTALLGQAVAKLNLSPRAYHRTLRIARTIADLASSTTIETIHLAEAIQYRRIPFLTQ